MEDARKWLPRRPSETEAQYRARLVASKEHIAHQLHANNTPTTSNGSTTSGRDSPTSNGEVDTRETDMSKEHIANELLNNLAPTTSNENPKNDPSSSTSNSEARTNGEKGSAIPTSDTIIIQFKQAVLSILIEWKSLRENEVRKLKGVGVMSRKRALGIGLLLLISSSVLIGACFSSYYHSSITPLPSEFPPPPTPQSLFYSLLSRESVLHEVDTELLVLQYQTNVVHNESRANSNPGIDEFENVTKAFEDLHKDLMASKAESRRVMIAVETLLTQSISSRHMSRCNASLAKYKGPDTRLSFPFWDGLWVVGSINLNPVVLPESSFPPTRGSIPHILQTCKPILTSWRSRVDFISGRITAMEARAEATLRTVASAAVVGPATTPTMLAFLRAMTSKAPVDPDSAVKMVLKKRKAACVSKAQSALEAERKHLTDLRAFFSSSRILRGRAETLLKRLAEADTDVDADSGSMVQAFEEGREAVPYKYPGIALTWIADVEYLGRVWGEEKEVVREEVKTRWGL